MTILLMTMMVANGQLTMVKYDIDDNNVNDNDGYQWIADSSIDGSLDGAMQEGGVLSERQ